jgi:hypothetical protein
LQLIFSISMIASLIYSLIKTLKDVTLLHHINVEKQCDIM